MSELQFIQEIQNKLRSNAFTKLSIGDDCALLNLRSHNDILITVDTLMDGTHFQLAETTPFSIGHKSLAVNLSDIAAMGGKAIAAVVALTLPKRDDLGRIARDLMQGIAQLADSFDVAIVGGDTNTWNGPLTIAITALGVPHQKGAILRKGAKVGDAILVTGSLGGSIYGHHLSFTPRLKEAQILMDHYELNSMIDISDGLATDLRHILANSGCAALLAATSIPIAAALDKVTDRQVALHRALCDGEDFELCFTTTPQVAARIVSEKKLPIPVTIVGHCIDGEGLYIDDPQSERRLLQIKGYEHEF